MKKIKEQISDEKRNSLMLGYLCVATEIEASIVRKVEILDRFHFADSDIALICACAIQTVTNSRQKLKKKKK